MNRCTPILILLLAAVGPRPTAAQEMVGVGIDEKPGVALPLDASFTDHTGKGVRLGDYFGDGRPVVLSLVYYRCAGVCSATLTGVAKAIDDAARLPLGENYRVVTLSFNPEETPALAAAKRGSYLSELESDGDPEGWVYLTGDPANIETLTEAVGFRYRFVEDTGEYAHDSAAILCTPDGRVSRYLRGSFYDPETFRLALVEASGGKIGAISDKVWVRICGYDPQQGRYVVMAQTIVMIGGASTMIILAAVVGLLFYREHQRNKKAMGGDVQPHAA